MANTDSTIRKQSEREDKRILSFESFEDRIGYHFKDRDLLERALTHRSYVHEAGKDREQSNERLEFLGDAVLELITSDRLYREQTHDAEGILSKRRASLVCEQALCSKAAVIGLGSLIFLGHGEEMSGGRKRPSITSDALEALIGAIYLDGGLDQAAAFINSFILTNLEEADFVDSKTRLQELVQRNGGADVGYRLIDERGPDHDKVFTMAVVIDGRTCEEGTGRTKKAAEQMAAQAALERLEGSQE